MPSDARLIFAQNIFSIFVAEAEGMQIHQFYDEGLAHASYAIISKQQVVLIDPARNPQPYLDFAREYDAQIIAIIETHPHADFVSSHLELHQVTGAPIYISRLLRAAYPNRSFDTDVLIQCGSVSFRAIDTPGHSPDSLCVLLLDESGKPNAVFTGDTLFVGDVGRPDLREDAGKNPEKAIEFAKALYHSLHQQLAKLPSGVIVYPAHGPGSLCGKNMGSELQSTIGREFRENYALQPMTAAEFVALTLKEQPFVPRYFAYDVALNEKGAPPFQASIDAVRIVDDVPLAVKDIVIDGRPQAQFKAGHYPGAINIPDGTKFETWLGSVVAPEESFYLCAGDPEALAILLEKSAKIGYESKICSAVITCGGPVVSAGFDPDTFKHASGDYTIVDIRNPGEKTGHGGGGFSGSIPIPLYELRERVGEIPTDKPIVVHCAGGYRSAIGASIVAGIVKSVPVFDMGTHIQHLSTIS